MLFLSIFLGMITGCALMILLARATSIPKIILGGFVLELSIIILLAEIFGSLHIPVSDSTYLSVFLVLAIFTGILAFRINPKLSVNGKDIALMVLALAIILVFFYFTFPSPLPSSDAVDTAGHYMMAENILETGGLTGPGSWYNILAPGLGYADYPYGYHAAAALISQNIGLPLIFMLQPIAELLVAVTIVITIFISIESTGCQRWIVAPLIALAIMSPYTFDILTSGYYSQLMGILLAVGFVWLLIGPGRNNAQRLVLLSVIEAALWLTYPYLAPIPLTILIIQLLYFRSTPLALQFVGIFIASDILALPRVLWFFQTGLGHYLPVTGASLPLRNLLPLTTVGALAFALFLVSARKRKLGLTELAAPSLFIAALLQTLGLYVLDEIQHYASYFLLKSGYLASFSIISMAGQLFRNLGSSFARKVILGSFLTVLITGNILFGVYVNYRAVERTQALSLTIPVYDAATWIRDNIPSNVTVWTIAAFPIPIWVFAISHHAPPQNGWAQPLPSKNQWLKEGIHGSTLLIVAGSEIPSDWFTSRGALDLTNFTVKFHEANVYVVAFNADAGSAQGDANPNLSSRGASFRPTPSLSVGAQPYVHSFSLTTVISVNRMMPVNNESKPMRPDAMETSAKFVTTRP